MAALSARNDRRIILHLVNSPNNGTSERGQEDQPLTHTGLRLLLRLGL